MIKTYPKLNPICAISTPDPQTILFLGVLSKNRVVLFNEHCSKPKYISTILIFKFKFGWMLAIFNKPKLRLYMIRK